MKKASTFFASALILIGLTLTAFAGWNTYGSDWLASQKQEQAVKALEEQFQSHLRETADDFSPEHSPESPAEPSAGPAEPTPGEAFGILRIPRFGDDYAKPLLEGFGPGADALTASNALLEEGVVRYRSTAQAGEQGNFAVSGHRNGFGAPFNRIMDLTIGDQVFVETEHGISEYRVIQEGLPFSPSDTRFIDGDPLSDAPTTDKSLMTITTCEDWDASQRVAVALELHEP